MILLDQEIRTILHLSGMFYSLVKVSLISILLSVCQGRAAGWFLPLALTVSDSGSREGDILCTLFGDPSYTQKGLSRAGRNPSNQTYIPRGNSFLNSPHIEAHVLRDRLDQRMMSFHVNPSL